MKEQSKKVGLEHNIHKTKIIASSPITFWQIDGESMETVTDFIFLGSEITVDGDCGHQIKMLAPWKKSYDNPRQHIKKQRYHFADKGPHSQSYGFPVVIHGFESWTLMKDEHQKIDVFKLKCWRRLLRVPWTRCLGQQGDQTTQSQGKSALNIHLKN